MKAKLLAIMWYFIDRLKEPYSYSGIIKIISAGGWAALDHSSRGEVMMQVGIIALGAIEFLLPTRTQLK